MKLHAFAKPFKQIIGRGNLQYFKTTFVIIFVVLLAVLEFELRVLYFLGRHSTIWACPKIFFALVVTRLLTIKNETENKTKQNNKHKPPK
jgi:hypothetical protein